MLMQRRPDPSVATLELAFHRPHAIGAPPPLPSNSSAICHLSCFSVPRRREWETRQCHFRAEPGLPTLSVRTPCSGHPRRTTTSKVAREDCWRSGERISIRLPNLLKRGQSIGRNDVKSRYWSEKSASAAHQCKWSDDGEDFERPS